MISKSKYLISDEQIKEIFKTHKIENIKSIRELGAGEFNSVYEIEADKLYVLKLAPHQEAVLTYENKMMESEVYWYKTISEQTNIRVPKVYFEDFTKSIVPTNYFVMEKIEGVQKDKLKLTKEEKEKANQEIVKMVAQLHTIKNDKFGYIQSGLYDNWYDAYRHIVSDLIADCKKADKKTSKGEKLLLLTEKHKDALNSAECCLANFDCWDPNFICTKQGEEFEFVWIDPERNLWGDRMLDFGCLDAMTPLKEKTSTLNTYNSVSNEPVTVTENEIIRYAFVQGLMGLIMEVEKYYRYTPKHFGWWRNVGGSMVFYKSAFKVLKNE